MSLLWALPCSILIETILSQGIGSDGFDNKPCLRLSNFSIDGNWWADEEAEVDWSSVMAGGRISKTDPQWLSQQNQCVQDGSRWGWWYKAGVFCDTMGVWEQSAPSFSNPEDNPRGWVPLTARLLMEEADLTNVYYVVSELEKIICVAFEKRTDDWQFDEHHVTIEFNQKQNTTYNDPTNCNPFNDPPEDWKCYFPQRTNGDFQIEFGSYPTLESSRIVISQWDDTNNHYSTTIRDESMYRSKFNIYYESNDTAIRAAINSYGPVNASDFETICNTDTYDPLTNADDCPTIASNRFFESCIDMKYLGFTSFNFTSIIIQTSTTFGSNTYKDTSGVLLSPRVSPGMLPFAYDECGMSPTSSPTAPTLPEPSTSPVTAQPSSSPTLNPSNSPIMTTKTPSDSPSKAPTKGPSTAPVKSEAPSSAPVTAQPSSSPTLNPSNSPVITTEPSKAPTKVPSYAPVTQQSSGHPSVYPITLLPSASPITTTFNPTQAPTPQDIHCNDAGIATQTNGAYYLHIDEQSIARFDTCRTLALFDIFIVDTNDTNKAYSCIECGSICYEPSQYQVTLSVGKYRMDVDGPHAFKMICTAKPDISTDAPTAPTTPQPTKTPSGYPTTNPTTLRPTEPVQAVLPAFNVSFGGDGVPISRYTFLGDPYGRFEAYIRVVVYDAESVLGVTALCAECFIWQYRVQNGVWTDIAHANNDDISVYNQQVTSTNGMTTFESSLTIQSIRRLNAGRCADENDILRLFLPGKMYELRLQFVVDKEYFVSSISNVLSIETNTLPSGGFCAIQDVDNLEVLAQFNLFCSGWENEDNLEYNALLKDVWMSKNTFVDDARKLQSVAPVGNVSITVMIKETNVDDAITCYGIHAAFKRIVNSSIVNSILTDVSSITNTTSFSEHPDVAVSIVTVIEEIYAQNLTTKKEAAQFVGDIAVNIMEESRLNKSDDIITGLSTMSIITSNADIVDAKTTTALVDTFLPQIFEAIVVIVDGSTNDSTAGIQDQLYTIAGQSQQLIENLESTLQTIEDNLNHLTQSLVDFALDAASVALSESRVGETFNYETTDTKTIIATKFDANIIDFNDSKDVILPKCGNEQQSIELPLSFMIEQDGVFDCAFMASSRNTFVSNQTRTQQSDTVSINIYNIGSIPNEYESNSCFPYLITIQISDLNYSDDMSLGDAHAFPSCDFWNIADSLWDTPGCFVYDISGSTITCACTHLTTFSVSKDKLAPEANVLTEIDWRQFTLYNLYHYPTVWLTCALLFIVFLFICWVSPILCDKIKTKSIMAFEDIIYKSVQEEKLWQDIAGKEIKYITDYMPNQHLLGRGLQMVAPTQDAKRSLCRLQWKLYGAYLRNDHTLLSVLQRTHGTNLSLNQRLGCFFMYLCNIMLVTGAWYGLEQSTPGQDVAASFIISLCSTLPVKIVRQLFQKSKPIEVKSTKHIVPDDDDDDDAPRPDPDPDYIDDDAGAGLTRTMTTARASEAWKQWDMKAWMKETNDVTISIFNAQIKTLYDEQKLEHKIRAAADIRSVLFDKMFPLSYGFKKVGWIVLIIWSLTACICAVVYGLKFDLEARAIDNRNNPNLALYQNDECWNNTLALQIEDRLSQQVFMEDYMEQQAKNESSYGGGDAKSWLISIFESLLTSLLLWQPLRIYVTTWIKIWMFSWHLKMSLGPKNIVSLCVRCCCGYDREWNDEEQDSNNGGQKSKLQMLSRYLSKSQNFKGVARRSSSKIRDVVAHKNRPVDIISFLGNDDWIIDDTIKTASGEGQEVELEAITQKADEKEPKHKEKGDVVNVCTPDGEDEVKEEDSQYAE